MLVCANLHLYWRVNKWWRRWRWWSQHTANCCSTVYCGYEHRTIVHTDEWANETRMSGGWGNDPGSLDAWTRPGPPPRTMPRLEGGLSRDLRRWRFSRTPSSVTERDWKLLYWQSIANDLVAVICHFTPRNTSMSGYKGHERLCSVIDWMPASHSPCKLIGLGRITTKDLKMGCGWSLQ